MQLFFNSMDCSLPGSSIHRISQARILEWGAVSFGRKPSQSRDQTCTYCFTGRFFTTKPPGKDFCFDTCFEISQNIDYFLKEKPRGGMNMAARRGQGSPVVLSGLTIAAGNARFVGSWVPIDWHPASRAQGCGPQ